MSVEAAVARSPGSLPTHLATAALVPGRGPSLLLALQKAQVVFSSWLSGPRRLLGPQPGPTPSKPTRHLCVAPGMRRWELTAQLGMLSHQGLEGSQEVGKWPDSAHFTDRTHHGGTSHLYDGSG